jgi:cytochrome c-type biogenesis protein CcmH/NrfG
MPNRAQPHAVLALIFVHVGKFGDAMQAASESLRIDPNYDIGRYARGLTAIQLAILDKTRPAESADPGGPDWLALALGDLEFCVQQKPVDLNYLVALGTAQGMSGDYAAAADTLTLARKINAGDANVQSLLKKAVQRESFYPQTGGVASSAPE